MAARRRRIIADCHQTVIIPRYDAGMDNAPDNSLPPPPKPRNPNAEGWAAGLLSAAVWTGAFSFINVAIGKLSTLHVKPPVKLGALFRFTLLDSLVMGSLLGSFHGYQRGAAVKYENQLDQLGYENAVLRGKLNQTSDVLTQVATHLDQSGRFADRIAAEKSEAAEAGPQIH